MKATAAARATTTGVYLLANLSTMVSAGARCACASSTMCTILAMVVSEAAAVARTCSVPPSMMDPANTWSPGPLATGADSPVTGAWSAAAAPSTTTPSIGGPLARPDHHDVAHDELGDVDGRLFELSVRRARAQGSGGGRRELHEAADGAPRALERRRLQHGAEAEEERDERRLRPLADGGGADHRQGHEDVHVDLAPAQAEEGGAGDVHAAGDDCGAEEPRRRGRSDGIRREARQREEAGDGGGDGPGLGEPEAGAGPRSRRRAAVTCPAPRRAARRCRSRGAGRRGTRRAAPPRRGRWRRPAWRRRS